MSKELSISKIPATKSEQEQLASLFIQKVLDGEISAIEAVIQMKSIGESISIFLKNNDIREAVIKETEKYGKGETPSYKGAVVQVKETSVKYDFAGCNDIAWDKLNKEKKEVDEKIKQRESFLKLVNTNKTEIDEETGEIYTIFPPARSSTTSYAITFKKQ